MTATGDRTLAVGALARVEGEGALHVRVRSGTVEDVRLEIYEPPRFFEGFLRGRRHTEPPDITARICGICPVAYQTSACQAIEDACGVVLPEPLAMLRRLLYCGEWVESHALHVHLLHAPDFLGYEGGLEMAVDHPDEVTRGLMLKKAGNELLELLGGRAIHPVNVRVGGFYRVPARGELRALRPTLEEALELAVQTVAWVGSFDAPDLTVDHELLALTHPGTYAIERGTLHSSGGLAFAPSDWLDHVVEEQVPHSTALHAQLVGATSPDGTYLVGPLARYSLNHGALSPLAQRAAREAGLDPVCRNPFRSIVVRAVETLYAVEEALRIIDAYEEPDAPAVPVPGRAGVGHGVSEAPRGVLYHRYVLDDEGLVTDARIVPPTSQNQAGIEHDLRRLVEQEVDLPDDALRHRCEQAIRNHDPCISCSTHFLDLRVDRA